MIAILLASSLAFADDPGIEVVQPGETFTPTVKVFALPEPYYDSCLEKAQMLEATRTELEATKRAVQPALDEAEEAITDLQSELTICGNQVGQLQLDLAVSLERNKSLRAQRNILIGTVAAVVVASVGTAWAVSQAP
jgi:hypothetical protein